jgi:hypothetical protein
VTKLDRIAFNLCDSLTTIILPDSIIEIGEGCFTHCKSLKSITIPRNVKHLGEDLFFGSNSLKEVIIKGKTIDEVKKMENYPFGLKDPSVIKCEP